MFEGVKKLFTDAKSDFRGWNIVEDVSDLEQIITASEEKPQLIYKHSSRCGSCFFAKSQMENAGKEACERIAMHFVDVIRRRAVSNHIAEELKLRHESPQAILIDAGQVVWHASHGSVTGPKLLEALDRGES